MLRFLHLVAFTQSFVFSQVEKKERVLVGRGGGRVKPRLCFQAGKFEVLCLEARFRVQHTV